MPQFDLDDAAVEADLIVEEVSCNMIELESENDESQCNDNSCVEVFVGQLCTPTSCSTLLHIIHLKSDETSSRAEDLTESEALSASVITHAFSEAVDSHDPDDMSSFNNEMVDDDEPVQMLTSEETQLVGKGRVNSVCTRESSSTGKILRLPELLVVNEGKSENSECMLNRLSNSDCLGLHVSNNPLQKIPKGQPEIWCLFGTQIVKTLLDTGVYKSLIRPTVLDRIQKDVILEKDDEIHTLHCANKTTNKTMGSV